MYEKVFEQAGVFFKPMNEIFEVNAQALEAFREKQTDLMNEVVADSIDYAKGLGSAPFDIGAYMGSQQSYFESLQAKLASNAKDNYELFYDLQGKVSELLQSTASTGVSPVAATEVNVAPAKAPAKKKAAAKKPAKAAPAKPPEGE